MSDELRVSAHRWLVAMWLTVCTQTECNNLWKLNAGMFYCKILELFAWFHLQNCYKYRTAMQAVIKEKNIAAVSNLTCFTVVWNYIRWDTLILFISHQARIELFKKASIRNKRSLKMPSAEHCFPKCRWLDPTVNEFSARKPCTQLPSLQSLSLCFVLLDE